MSWAGPCHYTCGMDNIFISEKFLLASYAVTKSKTMMHGVCQQKGRGLPNFFAREYYTKYEIYI